MKSVNEVRKLSGVSRRTLQYYDEIGLLPPSRVKESGYRQYDDASLRRLWSILFYKELGLSLGDIRVLLESPKETEKELLQQHKQLLLEKQADLEKLTLSVERILNDEFELSMLRDFDKNRIEAVREKYAKEIGIILESGFVRPLIKNGIIPDDSSFVENAAKIIHIDFDRVIALYIKVIRSFREAMQYGPDSLEAAEAVDLFVELLRMYMWIACDDFTLHAVAQAYLDYKDELNEKMPGVAEFVSAAIMHVYP